MKSSPLFLLLLVLIFSCNKSENSTRNGERTETATQTLDRLATTMLAYLPQHAPDSLKIPRAVNADGSLKLTPSRDWTSGFFPGTLWQLYDHSRKEPLKEAAEQWTAFVEKEKWDDHTHDLGFKLYCSFGKGYQLTDNQEYKDIVVQASKTLIERYNENVGCIRSWDFNADIWEFPVIIDNMMNLDMLFEATRLTGDSTYHQIAYQHANTTLQHHFRPDNSSYHVVVFDTISGNVIKKVTHQGHSKDSAWARGQAWGLYGFTMAYRWTKDPAFLEQAKMIAQFFTSHPNLPENKVPYWDFDAPNIPNEPRDVSAATVAASALIELSSYDSGNRSTYIQWVDALFSALTKDNYLTDISPFLLDHSTGSVPGDFEIAVPLVYADYYYVEALLRRKNLN